MTNKIFPLIVIFNVNISILISTSASIPRQRRYSVEFRRQISRHVRLHMLKSKFAPVPVHVVLQSVRILKAFGAELADEHAVVVGEINAIAVAAKSRLLVGPYRFGAVQFFAGVSDEIGICEEAAATHAFVGLFAFKVAVQEWTIF